MNKERAMERMGTSEVIQMLAAIAEAMSSQREYLIELDSVIGDGDLGITMDKGFRAAYAYAREHTDLHPGDLLMRSGMQIVKTAPSTMGTLMGSGLMRGGKAVSGKDSLDTQDIVTFFEGFLQGVSERGKAKRGEKTIIDVLLPLVEGMKAYTGRDFEEVFSVGVEGALAGLEAEKGMMSQHGKAAVFREKTLDLTDPGSAAIVIFIEACHKSVCN